MPNSTIHARAIEPPRESVLAALYPSAYFADAFSITLPPEATEDVQKLAFAALAVPSPWATGLLKMRDRIVVPLGIKGVRQIADEARQAGVEQLGIFPIRSRFENELVVGEKDRHLDFQASALVRSTAEGDARELILTTVVQCHGVLGRSYLAFILPFHKIIVRSNLERAANRGWPSAVV